MTSTDATDHYRTLQVTRDAEPEVIERAYRALSLKYHPDLVPKEQHARANARMQQINEAYRVLRDPVSRRDYDRSTPVETAWDTFMEKGLVGMFLEGMRAADRG